MEERPKTRLPKLGLQQALLIGILVLAAAGAIASVLIQRGGEEEPDVAPTLESTPEARKAVRALSLEQKAGAVLAAGADGSGRAAGAGAAVIGADAWAAGGPGLIERLRRSGGAKGSPPLIVGVQEGGNYRAYPDLPPAQSELQVGLTGDPATARSWSAETAGAMKRAGFDLNLGPVADVATIDSPIADRAFSDEPELTSAMTAAAVRGCKQSGLACAVKHFPGLGGASDDTAVSPATVSLDTAALEARDLAPFRAAFDAGAPAVVLSLAFYAAYDPITPAALSSIVATEVLRGELGFEGLAISDDLSSGAISAGLGAPEAAVQALAAGTDLVVVSDPGSAQAARAAILQAARDGGLSQARLDEAVARIFELKQRLGVLRQ